MIRAALALLAVAALAACGEDEADPEVPGGADPAAVRVIDEWSRKLRSGDVEGAAELFALPSVAENGVLVPIEDADAAVLFNASLPCGGRLIRAETQGEFTTATFRLTERPGPGDCGAGTGQTAQTAFVIEDGKIVEWRRVGITDDEDSPGSTKA